MLFTLSRSPAQCDLPTLLRQASPGDALLLLQDGVLAALAGAHLDLLLAAPISLYALRNDLEARGLGGHISHKVTVIDYNHFVELTTMHRSQMAW